MDWLVCYASKFGSTGLTHQTCSGGDVAASKSMLHHKRHSQGERDPKHTHGFMFEEQWANYSCNHRSYLYYPWLEESNTRNTNQFPHVEPSLLWSQTWDLRWHHQSSLVSVSWRGHTRCTHRWLCPMPSGRRQVSLHRLGPVLGWHGHEPDAALTIVFARELMASRVWKSVSMTVPRKLAGTIYCSLFTPKKKQRFKWQKSPCFGLVVVWLMSLGSMALTPTKRRDIYWNWVEHFQHVLNVWMKHANLVLLFYFLRSSMESNAHLNHGFLLTFSLNVAHL